MPGKLISMDELYYSRLLTIIRSTLGYLLIRDYSMGFIRRYLSMPNVLLLIALELMLLLIGLFSSHFSPLGFHCMLLRSA